MKKWLICFLFAAACLLSGCANGKAEYIVDVHTENTVSKETVTEVPVYDWGIVLTVKNVTGKGLTLVCTQSGGDAQGELQTGSWYEVQRFENGTWKKAEYTEIDEDIVGWTGEAWCIPKNETVEWDVDWSWLYDELPAGKYRIGKEIMDFMETGRYDETVIYAEFTIQ